MSEVDDFLPGPLPVEIPAYKSKQNFSREEVVWMLGFLLENPSAIEDAIHNDNTSFDAEELIFMAEGNMPNLAKQEHINQFRYFGEYYGYPSCCITWFEKYVENYDKMKLTANQEKVHGNKGFIPCPSCSKRVLQGLRIEELLKNRIHPQPYPSDQMSNSEADLTSKV